MIYYIHRTDTGIIVFEDSQKKELHITPIKYMNSICKINLRTYNTIKKIITEQLHIVSKIPIYINQQLMLFPTVSERKFNCVWINYFCVITYNKIDDFHTEIIFLNANTIIVNVKYNVINSQMKKCKLIAKSIDI